MLAILVRTKVDSDRSKAFFLGLRDCFGSSRAILKLPAETGKGLSGLEMPQITFSHIKNEYQTCFGVTSPFREFAGNRARRIAREDLERSTDELSEGKYFLLFKKKFTASKPVRSEPFFT